MKQSQLFTKTKKNAPSDEVSKNAQMLIRAGYIHKEFAGVYTLLPLGLRVVRKISEIIRTEMDNLGGVETQSSSLQTKEAWNKTNRWDDEVVDVWFKTNLKNGTELGLSFTNEEPLTAMMREHINSYKDLPRYTYDFKTIFRNEVRAKSGLMRGREFYWKALYSFSKDEKEHDVFYEKCKESYRKIFEKIGIGDTTYITHASGGSFAKFSHEFQTVCAEGEDTIYIDKEKKMAINTEVYNDEVLKELGVNKADLVKEKAVEVGNIFSLGDKFSEPLGLKYTDKEGKNLNVYMGSYGIGITRLLGVIAENLSDDKGLVFPLSIAPYVVHLICFGNNEEINNEAKSIYEGLKDSSIEVIFDDRVDVGPGEKLRDSDLIGIPYRLVISEKSKEKGGIEIKKRNETEVEYISSEEIIQYFQNIKK